MVLYFHHSSFVLKLTKHNTQRSTDKPCVYSITECSLSESKFMDECHSVTMVSAGGVWMAGHETSKDRHSLVARVKHHHPTVANLDTHKFR